MALPSTSASQASTAPVATGAVVAHSAGPKTGLQQRLLRIVATSRDKPALLSNLATVISETLKPVAVCTLRPINGAPGLAVGTMLGSGDRRAADVPRDAGVIAAGKAACSQAAAEARPLGRAEGLVAVAVPVLFRGPVRDVLCAIVVDSTPREPVTRLLEQAAAHVALWWALAEARTAETESAGTAALLEALGRLEGSRDLEHGCHTLLADLAAHLKCERVALGLTSGSKGSCRLEAISGHARFDRRGELVTVTEAALDEALLRDELTLWPAPDETQQHGALAHERLAEMAAAEAVVGGPLQTPEGEVVGGWLFVGSSELASDDTQQFIAAAAPRVAASLALLRRAEAGPVVGRVRSLIRRRHAWQAKAALIGAAVLAVLLCLPLKYKVGCDCEVQPVTRRFVAAPYDGTLEKSLVEPGDIVTVDQVLARLDGRELRWELAGLEADHRRAEKTRDAAMAALKVADAQKAKLEMERLELKMQLVDSRMADLEIESPLDGIVISGDLEKAEGVPLSVGQSLFEIAPLDAMVVEVAVPEHEIAHVEAGATVTFRVDAYPRREWSGTIDRIDPRAELREHENVFVAEVHLENGDRLLRPGMKGRAKVVGRRHTLAWNLFHRPLELLALRLGW